MKQSWRAAVIIVTVLCAVSWGTASSSAAALNLHRGSRGPLVHTLELRLHTLHLLRKSQVDRRYKAATVRAVKRFQRQQTLRVTGRVDVRTWNRVASEYTRRTTAPKPRPAPAPAAPTILGHRGARVPGIPENTMASMRYASRTSDILEFDLQLTSDEQFVLMHDRTLDRTTNCSGRIEARTLQDLQANCVVDLNAASAPSERIPSFEQVAQYAAGISMPIAPEVKDGSISVAASTGFLTTVTNNGLVGRTYVQSFDKAILQRLKAAEPALTYVYVVASSVSPQAVVESGATIAGPNLSGLTAARVAAFKAAGLRVWAWTAANTTQLKSLWDMRVDGVFTDIPASARSMYHPS